MRKPYRNFNLPTRHLAGTNPYIPPKARSTDEIERRHLAGKGNLILEQELLGIAVGALVLSKVEDKPDLAFVTKVLAPAATNTAAEKIAKTNDVMSRILKLTILRESIEKDAVSSEHMHDRSKQSFDHLAGFASSHLIARANKSPDAAEMNVDLGRSIGNAALDVSVITIADSLRDASPRQAQFQARVAGLETLQTCHDLADQIGTAPTLAQLADPDSDLAVHIRRTAPNGAFDAFDEAFSTLSMPR